MAEADHLSAAEAGPASPHPFRRAGRGRPRRIQPRKDTPKIKVECGVLRNIAAPLSFEARLHQRHLNAAIRLIARQNGDVVRDVAKEKCAQTSKESTRTAEKEDAGDAISDSEAEDYDEDDSDFETFDPSSGFTTVPVLTSARFFSSLARRSRLRPDLIAVDLGLDEYEVRLQLAHYEQASRASTSHCSRYFPAALGRHDAAREVSSGWVEREEGLAAELLVEEKKSLEINTRKKRLVQLVQAEGDEVTAERHAREQSSLSAFDSAADAFDLAQRRHARHCTASLVAESAPSGSGSSSMNRNEAYTSPIKAFESARMAEEEATFQELSLIPVGVRSEEEQALLVTLRTRLRSRKRKRNALAQRKRLRNGMAESEDGGRQESGNATPVEAVLAPLEHLPDLPVVDSSPRLDLPATASKRARTWAYEEIRMGELKAIGRKNMTEEQVKEWVTYLKRRAARERGRRKKAASAATDAVVGSDDDGDEAEDTDVDRAAGTGEGDVNATISGKPTMLFDTEVESDQTYPEREECLFNVAYFRGIPQSPEAISNLHTLLREFLVPAVRRSITYAEILAPSLAAAQRAKALHKAQVSALKQTNGSRGMGRIVTPGGSLANGTGDVGMGLDDNNVFARSATANTPDAYRAEAVKVGITLGSVLMALNPADDVDLDDPAVVLADDSDDIPLRPKRGSLAAAQSNAMAGILENMPLSRARALLALDEMDRGGKGNGEEDEEYLAEEAELDERLDAIDSAFDKLAEDELRRAFRQGSAREQDGITHSEPNDNADEEEESTERGRRCRKDWCSMMLLKKMDNTGNEDVDNLLSAYTDRQAEIAIQRKQRAHERRKARPPKPKLKKRYAFGRSRRSVTLTTDGGSDIAFSDPEASDGETEFTDATEEDGDGSEEEEDGEDDQPAIATLIGGPGRKSQGNHSTEQDLAVNDKQDDVEAHHEEDDEACVDDNDEEDEEDGDEIDEQGQPGEEEDGEEMTDDADKSGHDDEESDSNASDADETDEGDDGGASASERDSDGIVAAGRREIMLGVLGQEEADRA